MYTWAIDISLSNSGIAIFNEDEYPVYVFSIPTNSKTECKDRLKIIADIILEKRIYYNTELIILEAGFSRFHVSTQMIFRVHGLINYLFYDCEQIYYAPSTIKKIICGSGRADKKQVQNKILETYPKLEFK